MKRVLSVRILPFSLSAFVAAYLVSCGGQAPDFPTSDTPPEDEPTETLKPPELPIVRIGAGSTAAERIVQLFFLALSTGDREGLNRILSPSARFRYGSNTSRNSARDELLTLFQTRGPGSRSGGSTLNTPGEISIVAVVPLANKGALVTVKVGRPTELSGAWKLRISTLAGKSRIAVVAVPARN